MDSCRIPDTKYPWKNNLKPSTKIYCACQCIKFQPQTEKFTIFSADNAQEMNQKLLIKMVLFRIPSENSEIDP